MKRLPRPAKMTAAALLSLAVVVSSFAPAWSTTFDEAEMAYVEANRSKDAKHPGYAKAFEIWSALAGGGDAASMYHLGVLHLYGLGGARFDQVRGFSLIKSAAEAGYAKAQAYLGVMHEKGQGLHTVKDPSAALAWYRRAALAGHCYSLRRIVRAYENGELGVASDPVEAAEYPRHHPQCFEAK